VIEASPGKKGEPPKRNRMEGGTIVDTLTEGVTGSTVELKLLRKDEQRYEVLVLDALRSNKKIERRRQTGQLRGSGPAGKTGPGSCFVDPDRGATKEKGGRRRGVHTGKVKVPKRSVAHLQGRGKGSLEIGEWQVTRKI